ncbi:FecR domain-containing protein [Delftia tsuruhatensis]|uniref:FecR domain-containing protein n=1 Tax=Delftia tsuruhatensis TaxID=180282 RepID=UPI0028A22063|nr:FecR domain-containing protein [Delftia tsuruhatensis]
MSSSPASPDASSEPLEPAIVQRAAEWMARLWADDASDEDRAACARWRAEHPRHELAWSRLQAFDDKLRSVPGGIARHTLADTSAASPAPRGRRRAMQLLGLMATAGGIAHVVRGTDAWQIAAASHGTARGEVREITLPDGTQVVLASASAIDLRFDEAERLILLRAGEILVTTAPDPQSTPRPLRVRSRHGTVQALGTRFTLRQEDEQSRVAVFEGAVEVRPARAPGQVVRVDAGQGAVFTGEQARAPVPAQESAAAWARGVLVADNMPLGELVAELARYRTGLLRCDPQVAGLRVTGVFSLRDTDRALHNLALGLPVQVVSRTRYWVTVQAAG